MRKHIKQYITGALALLLALCTVGCAGKNTLKMNSDGSYVDKKTKVAYAIAPASYEPIASEGEAYGKIGDSDVYGVVGVDTSRLLCDSNGTVFYAESIELPTLDEMEISYVSLVSSDGTTLADVDSADVISALVNVYCMGNEIRKPLYSEEGLSVSWHLKFADSELGLFYALNYIELKEDYIVTASDGTKIDYGNAFIFNRYENRCVAVGDLLSSYVAEYGNSN